MKFNNSGEIMKIMTLKCINHKGSHAQVACQSKVRERKGELFFCIVIPIDTTCTSSTNRDRE